MTETIRAHSTLTLKAVSSNAADRTIVGIASTPTPDSSADVVEPMGAVFSLPLPLLWQHDHQKPIGNVISAKATAAGIEIVAKIATVVDPGTLKDRVDEAWHSITAGLVRGLSIGFIGLKASPLKGGGRRFEQWRWLELSAVTIPANAEASISAIKAADASAIHTASLAVARRPGAVSLTTETRATPMAKPTTTSHDLFGVPPGLAAVRALKSLALSKNDLVSAESYVSATRWQGRNFIADFVSKGTVPITDTSIYGASSPVGGDLQMALHPLTLLGRLPGLRSLPSRTRLIDQTTAFRGYWFAEGRPLAMSATAFAASQLDPLKVGALTVVSNELLRNSNLDAEKGILADLLAACAEAIDRAFILPSNLGVSGTMPASITSSATPIVVSASTQAGVDAGLTAAALQLVAQGNSLSTAVWVIGPKLALQMSLMRGSGGQPIYPGLSALGGTLAGLPVVATAAAPDGTIVLLDPSEIGYATGEPRVSTSTNAAIQMSSAPGTAAMVTPASMFQEEATALMIAVPLSWRARRQCAAVVSGISL